ncbi:SDR family oxidoreductase [Aeromicrobium chenweiae]|uniref:Oxidoreductase n=1 Tax=Aeromicrobium chenweiae TaxID=2079793 RepID=A0A2S0WQA8_9ACTN|nr:SDR family NAD(P)-dependent oxidoreductase [Aeromicrobium chenweiae]AWB93539.1 oxidoreductase [Aeromicrobium chenweiae]TGN33189.1 SDR family NAD(P)-dependent oxidoreductase [Aeromicrobium chenweiae]
MDITSRTVLIAGGTAGIGLEMARRLTAAGSSVVVGGRRVDRLTDIAAEGIGTVELDVSDPASVERARDSVLASFPDLDTVVTMAGVQLIEDVRDPGHIATAEQIVQTNLLGTIRVIDAFTPHLLARGTGTFVTVSSGIGFLPFPLMPTYGASKAAVHAYSESLRAQLDGTGVDVVELVPPAVATSEDQRRANPAALDVGDFVEEVLTLLAADPTPHELLVGSVQTHRWAERDGTYDELVAQRSKALASLPGR